MKGIEHTKGYKDLMGYNNDHIFLHNWFATFRKLLLETDIKTELLAFRDLCLEVQANGNKLIFAGNGASASISSQAATDYTQHAKVRAMAFNDHNLITAFGNDYGYENWVVRSLEAYADPGDVVVLISSSGTSPNIVNAARYAGENKLRCVSFSGFAPDNPLRAMGQPSLWVNSSAYNMVEGTHLIWILLVANLLENNDGDDTFIDRGLSAVAQILTPPNHENELLRFADICREVLQHSGKLIFVGNGGSSSIASHAATDFTKQSRVRSVAFNDHNLLTAFANDHGQENWAARAIDAYAESRDAVVLISSSGKSANILKSANWVREKHLPLVTFTGFDPNNPLRRLGDINFWADTQFYSLAEAVHSGWIFSLCDLLTE